MTAESFGDFLDKVSSIQLESSVEQLADVLNSKSYSKESYSLADRHQWGCPGSILGSVLFRDCINDQDTELECMVC